MSIDRDFEQVSEEHMKSMTKPEGPAQEPQRNSCAHCGLRIYKMTDGMYACQWAHHGSNYRHCHSTNNPEDTATPAPSQPAGAREWLRQHSIDDVRVRASMTTGWTARDLSEVLEAYAAHQAAAKDAEIERLRLERDEAKYKTAYRCGCYVCGKQAPAKERHLRLFCEEHKDAHATFQRAVAAERERDSLRAENDEAYRQLGLENYEGEDGLAHHIAILQAQNAALKAGKRDV